MHLETGDLLLFTQKKSITGWWLIDKTIEYFTNSPYVHVGLVVVDPPFSVSSGTYVWECGYEACVNPETGKQNIGVRLTPISVVLSNEQTIYVRKCKRKIRFNHRELQIFKERERKSKRKKKRKEIFLEITFKSLDFKELVFF